MKVVILCGGQGTRLREETEYRPKPLVPIGGMPIIWHIMKTYSHYGYRDFVLCLGHKGEMIKDYFLKFEELSNDFTLNLRSKHERIIYHNKAHLEDWNITFINTGEKAQTGSRVARIKDYLGDDEFFFLTYGDGVANVDISRLLKFHQSHGKVGTITGVRPPSRFGEILADGSRVVEFKEKPAISKGLINGGFFVFSKKLFHYLSVADDCVLEREPLEALARKGELMINAHAGFWHCMDTYRDYLWLNERWAEGDAAWRI